MTEEEAKTKWCPHVRYSFNESAPSNRWNQSPLDGEPNALNPIACRCIGSACMMWHELPSNKDVRADTYFDNAGNPYRRTYGYCGLAGRP